jgi:hypothetical protein
MNYDNNKQKRDRSWKQSLPKLKVALPLVVVSFLFMYNANVKIHRNKLTTTQGPVQSQTRHKKMKKKKQKGYTPANVEKYIMDNMEELGFDKDTAKGCDIWKSPDASTNENYNQLQAYGKEIQNYYKAINKKYSPTTPMPDLMETIRKQHGQGGNNWDETCKSLRPHPDGIQALFPSNQLSSIDGLGYMEPLLTPMRHHQFCVEGEEEDGLFNMEYMVHDFEALCLKMKPTSRRVLIDMGASLVFHTEDDSVVPIMFLLELYEKFGFNFDHIYAFEVEEQDAEEVYKELLPKKYFSSYHWINAGVSADKDNNMNPLYSIINQFNEDDIIIVKLDIDTGSIEVPLAKQLLEDDSINKLVDHFYFEHHVNMEEIEPWWDYTMEGTIKDTFELMNGLRKKGVAAHFWP